MSSLREHIERCEHAVDEPDWAGLRELPKSRPDHTNLIGDARVTLGMGLSLGPAQQRQLIDAIDALVEERDSFERLWKRLDQTSEKHYENLIQDRFEAAAQAWDEGLSAGADRWMDSREFGDPPVNPYRSEGVLA